MGASPDSSSGQGSMCGQGGAAEVRPEFTTTSLSFRRLRVVHRSRGTVYPQSLSCRRPSPRVWMRRARTGRTAPYAGGMNSYLTDQRDRPVSAFIAVVVALLTGGYMLPWAVAALRGKSNHWTIFWINLLGGWTVILWIVALVMSFGSHKTISRY